MTRRQERYPLDQSPFYKLRTKRDLFRILKTNKVSFQEAMAQEPLYKDWTNNSGRDVSSPAKDLKLIQRRIAKLLCRIEVPDYLKSAIKHESYVTNAQTHATGSRVVKTDISKFFPSISDQRIFDLFYRKFRCSPDVSKILTRILSRSEALATGSPASTIASYLCNKNMFDGMANLAKRAENRMTVYVDDITFSGKGATPRFLRRIKEIAGIHGYKTHKDRAYRKEEAKKITGVVVKDRSTFLPNERHKRIHERLEQLKTTEYAYDDIFRKLLGSLNEANQVQPNLFGPRLSKLKRRRISHGLPDTPNFSNRRLGNRTYP